jgi:hypothetical protein
MLSCEGFLPSMEVTAEEYKSPSLPCFAEVPGNIPVMLFRREMIGERSTEGGLGD